MQGGRAHELARSRIIIGIEQNSPAKPHAVFRPGILSEHPPNLSFEEKDAASALGQFSMTRPLSATSKASGPQRHHRRGSAGTLFSCMRPCLRALDGADGSVLRGEGGSGKEISITCSDLGLLPRDTTQRHRTHDPARPSPDRDPQTQTHPSREDPGPKTGCI